MCMYVKGITKGLFWPLFPLFSFQNVRKYVKGPLGIYDFINLIPTSDISYILLMSIIWLRSKTRIECLLNVSISNLEPKVFPPSFFRFPYVEKFWYSTVPESF